MLATLGQLQGGGLPAATYLLGQLLEAMRLENVRARRDANLASLVRSTARAAATFAVGLAPGEAPFVTATPEAGVAVLRGRGAALEAAPFAGVHYAARYEDVHFSYALSDRPASELTAAVLHMNLAPWADGFEMISDGGVGVWMRAAASGAPAPCAPGAACVSVRQKVLIRGASRAKLEMVAAGDGVRCLMLDDDSDRPASVGTPTAPAAPSYSAARCHLANISVPLGAASVLDGLEAWDTTGDVTCTCTAYGFVAVPPPSPPSLLLPLPISLLYTPLWAWRATCSPPPSLLLPLPISLLYTPLWAWRATCSPPPLPTVAPTCVPTVHSLPPSLAGRVAAPRASHDRPFPHALRRPDRARRRARLRGGRRAGRGRRGRARAARRVCVPVRCARVPHGLVPCARGVPVRDGRRRAPLLVCPCHPPPPGTIWTRRVPHPVLIGHAASLTP
jgi:hypothetical protein